ncbi:MAG: 8-oxo-dGTP diphosphatase [Patescibacteria group bacterium]
MRKKILTLCIIHQSSRVLLGMKKQGFGAGRWNGFGGKVELGEAIEDAARREVREEAGVEVLDIEKAGIIEFEFSSGGGSASGGHGNSEILEVHIFRSGGFSGEPAESDEMRPQWFAVDEIPFASMWPDDTYWFPLFLKGKKFHGRFLFGDGDKVLEYSLSEVKQFA